MELAFELRLSAFAEQPLSEAAQKSSTTSDAAIAELESRRSPLATVQVPDGQGVAVGFDRGNQSGIDNGSGYNVPAI